MYMQISQFAPYRKRLQANWSTGFWRLPLIENPRFHFPYVSSLAPLWIGWTSPLALEIITHDASKPFLLWKSKKLNEINKYTSTTCRSHFLLKVYGLQTLTFLWMGMSTKVSLVTIFYRNTLQFQRNQFNDYLSRRSFWVISVWKITR